MKLSDIPKFLETHIFTATGGAIREGRVEGRKNEGANGGAIFGVHGGALEGRS